MVEDLCLCHMMPPFDNMLFACSNLADLFVLSNQPDFTLQLNMTSRPISISFWNKKKNLAIYQWQDGGGLNNWIQNQ